MAWEKWQFEYEEEKRSRFFLSGALTRLRNRQLSMAWEQWQFWYDEVVRQKALLQNALGKMRHRQLAMGFTKWRTNKNMAMEAAILFWERHQELLRLHQLRTKMNWWHARLAPFPVTLSDKYVVSPSQPTARRRSRVFKLLFGLFWWQGSP